MSIIIDCHGESHMGRHRSTNEDQFLIADLNKSMRVHQTSLGLNHQTRLFGGSQGKLMLVADGLGGHESGERASTLAVDGVANYMLNSMDWLFRVGKDGDEELFSQLKQAFRHSQQQLEAESDAIPQRRGMATTLTMAYVDWPALYVVHVGDTRCYHIHQNTISCLTTDHTIAQLAESVAPSTSEDRGRADNLNDTAPYNPMANSLWNVVGGHNDSLQPQVMKSTLEIGDSLLLCSDGLTRYVGDQELLLTVSNGPSSKHICQQFIDMANQRGGKDNITVVLARFVNNETHLEDCEEQKIAEEVPVDVDTIELTPPKSDAVA